MAVTRKPHTSHGIHVAIMAAGESTRFGATKQLVEVAGEALVRRACVVATRVCGPRTLLVVGHEWRAVQEASGHPYFIINERYQSGLGSSIAAATRALCHTANGLLIMLADQVRIAPDDLDRLIQRHRANPDCIVVSRYSNDADAGSADTHKAMTKGPPTIFPASAFGDLATLDRPDGARSLIDSGRYRVTEQDCENARLDIDRPADLRVLDEDRR